jgi:peptidyl-prolyl cis-trans isomerase D
LASKRSKTSTLFAWLIVFILVIGLAGFGIQDVLRSSGTNEIATFGNQKISSDDYVRMIQQETRSLSQRFGTPLSFSQAQSLGVAQIALQKLISSAILDQTVQDLGFSQSDQTLKETIKKNPAFSDIAGRFDPKKYEDVLLNVNLQPTEYEEILRKELSRNVLLDLTSTKVSMDEKTKQLIINHLLEERVSDIIILSKNDLDSQNLKISIEETTDFFESNKDLFTQPETKKVSYIYVSPKSIAKNQEVSDEQIQSTFLTQKELINTPEKRDVDQIFFVNRESAEIMLASERTKILSFEKALQTRGLTKADVSLGEIIQSELPATAQEAVFFSPGPAVTQPIETELGLAIYRVNRVIPAVTKTLDDVYESIKSSIALEKASAELNVLVNQINDEIAAGASLEDIANTTELNFGTLEFFSGADVPDFANTTSFREMLQSAKSYASDIQFNDDGGIFSLRIDETLDPFVKDFDKVKKLVSDEALKQKIISTLEDKAIAIREEQKKSGLNLVEFAENWNYELLKNKTLSRFVKMENLPDSLLKDVFSMEKNEYKVVLDAAKVYLVQLKDIVSKELDREKSNSLQKQITSQFVNSLEQDMVKALIDGLETNHSLYISQKAVDSAIQRFN